MIEINKVRANPSSYIPYVEAILKQMDGNIWKKPGEDIPIETAEGPAAVKEAIAHLKKQKPVGSLTLEQPMTKAAKVHVDDIGPKGLDGHDGSDGSGPSDRIERFCQWDVTVGENIDFGGKTGQDSVISFIIDDGVDGRGHRTNLFNPEFKIIGISAGAHTTFDRCLVVTFAGGIVGKATNNNADKSAPADSKKGQAADSKPADSKKGQAADSKPAADTKKEDPAAEKKNSLKPAPVNFKTYESEFIIETNKVRQNPQSYVPLLENLLKYFKGNVLSLPGKIPLETNEGPSAIKDAINFLKKCKPLEPLTEDKNLGKSARDHLNDIGPKGLDDHTGSNGSTPDQRISKYVKWDKTNAENIDFGSTNAQDSVISFLVDDGVSTRGHRKNLMSTEQKFFGCAAGVHKTMETCLVVNFIGGYEEKGGNSKAKNSVGPIAQPNSTNNKSSAPLNTAPTPKSSKNETLNTQEDFVGKYTLMVDTNDVYEESDELYYVNPKRIKTIIPLNSNIFSQATVKNVPVDQLTAVNLNIILKKLNYECGIDVIINQPLSIMLKYDAKQVEANLKMAGFTNVSINDYEDEDPTTQKKIKTLAVSGIRPAKVAK